ncbi:MULTISPECIES: hypothetical protein [unclassified Luteococcus]|uniref:hypothetical protein n=1 Tax=unclassified Luteococcus TaxID=2639923 RepID=UPI00313AE50A
MTTKSKTAKTPLNPAWKTTLSDELMAEIEKAQVEYAYQQSKADEWREAHHLAKAEVARLNEDLEAGDEDVTLEDYDRAKTEVVRTERLAIGFIDRAKVAKRNAERLAPSLALVAGDVLAHNMKLPVEYVADFPEEVPGSDTQPVVLVRNIAPAEEATGSHTGALRGKVIARLFGAEFMQFPDADKIQDWFINDDRWHVDGLHEVALSPDRLTLTLGPRNAHLRATKASSIESMAQDVAEHLAVWGVGAVIATHRDAEKALAAAAHRRGEWDGDPMKSGPRYMSRTTFPGTKTAEVVGVTRDGNLAAVDLRVAIPVKTAGGQDAVDLPKLANEMARNGQRRYLGVPAAQGRYVVNGVVEDLSSFPDFSGGEGRMVFAVTAYCELPEVGADNE